MQQANEKLSISGQYRLRTLLKQGDTAALIKQFDQVDPAVIATYLSDINLDVNNDTWEVLQSLDNFLAAVGHDDSLRKNVQKNMILHLLFSQDPAEDYKRFATLLTAAFVNNPGDNLPSTLLGLIDVILVDHLSTFALVEPATLVNFLLFASRSTDFKVPASTIQLLSTTNLLQKLPTNHNGVGELLNNYSNAPSQIDIAVPSTFSNKKVCRNVLFLDDALSALDFIIKKQASVSNDGLLLMTNHQEVALKMLDHPVFASFIALHYDEIAKKHYSFAAKILRCLQAKQLVGIPDKADVNVMANMPNYVFLMKVKEGDPKSLSFWHKARLYLQAQLGDDDCLQLFIQAEGAHSIVTNQLCLAAYSAGNIAAGLQFADNVFQGDGVVANEQQAVEFYQLIADDYPEQLTEQVLTRLVEPLLYKVQTLWAEFEQMRSISVAPKETSKQKTKRYNHLQHNLAAHNSRLFQYTELLNPATATSASSDKDVIAKANEAIKCLTQITNIKLDDRTDLQEVFCLQTAHAIWLKFLIEQKDNYTDNDWQAEVKRSLKFAWNYDQHDQADPELAVFVERTKRMPGQLAGVIQEIENELQLEAGALPNQVVRL